MRFEPLVLALPALAAAEQVPLMDQMKGWFNKATAAASAYVPAPSAASLPNPVDAGAAAISSVAVDRVTLDNWKELVVAGGATASPGVEEWMIYITGANKTCFGMCEHAEKAWNQSVPLLEASKNAPHLALLNCETDPVLCNAFALGPPSVLHMFLPQPLPDQSKPATTVRTIPLNRTSVTTQDIVAIHTEEKYKEHEPYEGFWHPFDGPLAKNGLAIPFGYVIWGFSAIPSWMFMIFISFFSRTIM